MCVTGKIFKSFCTCFGTFSQARVELPCGSTSCQKPTPSPTCSVTIWEAPPSPWTRPRAQWLKCRYKPWGEVKFTTANETLPTRYTFTGQYSHMSDDATDLGSAGCALIGLFVSHVVMDALDVQASDYQIQVGPMYF